MIDLNKIRSLKKLESIRADLTEFLSNPDVPEVYKTEYKWGEEDYDADRADVEELLEKVDRRMKSLSKFIQREGKEIPEKTVTEASPKEEKSSVMPYSDPDTESYIPALVSLL